MRSILLLGLFSISSAASAQDAPVFEQSMSWPEVATINQFGLLASQNVKGTKDRFQARRDQPGRSSGLLFVPSSARRRANYAQFVEKSRRADPAGADSLAANLASDPISKMEPELAKYGLRTDNVADAYTVYWTEAWEAAHGVTSEGSREQAQAVKQQAAAAILATPAFQHATDARKQEFADALLVQALLIGAAKDQAHGDAAKLRQIATAVRQGARATGLDLDAMTLTDHGFVPADRTGAADPAPGAERRAVGRKG